VNDGRNGSEFLDNFQVVSNELAFLFVHQLTESTADTSHRRKIFNEHVDLTAQRASSMY